jgi:glycosyltransferase involved in cell wall biosynthesis
MPRPPPDVDEEGGVMTTSDRAPRVVLVVEQLRRAVPGGIGRYINGLLQGLGDMGKAGEPLPDVLLYASRPPSGGDPLAGHGFEVISSFLPGVLLTRGWDRGLLPAPGPSDVVHATSQAAPPSRHRPLVVTVHDMAWRQVPEAFPARGRRWHEASFERARRHATRMVVPSASTAQAVAEAGVERSSIAVIGHGADHLPDADQAATAALLARLGVTSPFLLSVGTLEPRKNLTRLVEAYRHFRDDFPEPLPLVVVGPAGWGESPTSASAVAAMTDVVFTGPVDDATLAGLYERALLLAYVPLMEGFGFPPVEAMGRGLPVVASAMPSLGGGALVVDPGNVDDIAHALVRVAGDDGLRGELVARGHERVAGMTWAASARAHVDLWLSVSGSAPAEPGT